MEDAAVDRHESQPATDPASLVLGLVLCYRRSSPYTENGGQNHPSYVGLCVVPRAITMLHAVRHRSRLSPHVSVFASPLLPPSSFSSVFLPFYYRSRGPYPYTTFLDRRRICADVRTSFVRVVSRSLQASALGERGRPSRAYRPGLLAHRHAPVVPNVILRLLLPRRSSHLSAISCAKLPALYVLRCASSVFPSLFHHVQRCAAPVQEQESHKKVLRKMPVPQYGLPVRTADATIFEAPKRFVCGRRATRSVQQSESARRAVEIRWQCPERLYSGAKLGEDGSWPSEECRAAKAEHVMQRLQPLLAPLIHQILPEILAKGISAKPDMKPKSGASTRGTSNATICLRRVRAEAYSRHTPTASRRIPAGMINRQIYLAVMLG